MYMFTPSSFQLVHDIYVNENHKLQPCDIFQYNLQKAAFRDICVALLHQGTNYLTSGTTVYYEMQLQK